MNSSDRYRLAALLEIALAAPQALAIAEIAQRRGVPAAYLSHLLRDLRRGGWLESRRGPGGGVKLAREPEEIPIAAVLEAKPPRQEAGGAVGQLETLLGATLLATLQELSLADLLVWERQSLSTHEFVI